MSLSLKDGPDEGWEFQRKRQYILKRARLEAQLACQQYTFYVAQKVIQKLCCSQENYLLDKKTRNVWDKNKQTEDHVLDQETTFSKKCSL